MSSGLHSLNVYKLSRLLITGKIDISTPLCVRREIADASGIICGIDDLRNPVFLFEMMETINSIQIKEWRWGDIARFVNKNCNWPQRKLLQAYEFLCSFMNGMNNFDKLPHSFEIGEQTPEKIYNINSCILYSICKKLDINCTEQTTIQQMATIIRMHQCDTLSLKRRVDKYLASAGREELLRILFLSPEEILDFPPGVDVNYNVIPQSKNTSSEMLDSLHTHLHNINVLQSKIDPETPNGAIALAAIIHKLDLSYCNDPVLEYKNLRFSGIKYIPADPWLQYWHKINPSLFDLKVTFNPLFPPSYYDEITLKHILLASGHSEKSLISGSLRSYYEALQIEYVTENFYSGLHPALVHNHTIINLDSVSSLPSTNIICYGFVNNSLQCTTYDELYEMFRINRNFSSPFKRDSMFSENAIQKLKKLSSNHPNLLTLICEIDDYNKTIDPYTRELLSIFHKSSIEQKEYIYQCLLSLLHVGMYMRGWTGPPNEYPLKPGLRQKNDHLEMEIRVNTAIGVFEKHCQNLSSIGNIIYNLPLTKCVDGKYCVSTDNFHGLTIGERLRITKLGEQTDNMSSCVRLTSNWFCGSAHKYLTLLSFPPPFNIHDINAIS